MINPQDIITHLQEDTDFLSEDLLIIVGPTASGKTKLAVALAKQLDAEIISADSRQVYRQMNIGTGKDLSEYQNIPYHLIDILNPGEKYNIDRFLADFETVYLDILSRNKKVIVCGGTGFYIQSLLQPQSYIQIPIDGILRQDLELKPKEELISMLKEAAVPKDFKVDFSSRKRIIRALEICSYLAKHPHFVFEVKASYRYKIIGLNPAIEVRRHRISKRLEQRLDEGMIQEVEYLLQNGLSYEELEYYGLEYKYIAYYLKGFLSHADFYKKLETEIHRYAKRQMTYFRKMEKDGIKIIWF